MYTKNQYGFTLLEVAIVLTVVGYLLKVFVTPFGARFEQDRRDTTKLQLESILDSVVGFVAANHRMPCPASESSNGVEIIDCAGSDARGYVPAVTLGLTGSRDREGRLLDSWGSPIYYAVSNSDNAEYGVVGKPDFTSTGEMRAVGMRYLQSELTVCRQAMSGACPETKQLANQLPLVVLSTGKDVGVLSDESENQDQDSQFVQQPFSQNSEHPFDDIVVWLSENHLFYQLIQSGVLP